MICNECSLNADPTNLIFHYQCTPEFSQEIPMISHPSLSKALLQ